MATPWYNVFVGTETGLLKGVNTAEKYFKNVNPMCDAGRDREISAMCWSNTDETQICCALKNRLLKVYNCRKRSFEPLLEVTGGEGPIKSVINYDGHYLTCVESGLVKLWKDGESEKENIEFEVGANVWRMRQNPQIPHQIATGGKENELKIWDLNSTETPIFNARNVPHDFLDHRVPVWVTDMQFSPDGNKIVTCTGHRHIRMYDRSTPQRRPVINIEFDEYPLTALSLTYRENWVVSGNTRGRMALFDLRKGLLVHSFKGFAGSIRNIACHPTEPLVASCGLDRFLRVHNINSKSLLHKVYLKSRLNCLLFRQSLYDSTEMDLDEAEELSEEVPEETVDHNQDELWDRLEIVKGLEKDDRLKKTGSKLGKKKNVNGSSNNFSPVVTRNSKTKKNRALKKNEEKGNFTPKKKNFSKKITE